MGHHDTNVLYDLTRFMAPAKGDDLNWFKENYHSVDPIGESHGVTVCRAANKAGGKSLVGWPHVFATTDSCRRRIQGIFLRVLRMSNCLHMAMGQY